MFRHIFTGLEERYAKDLAVIRTQYASEPVAFTNEPCILHWDQAMKMLQDAACEVDVAGDLSGANELRLGELVKEKMGADFFMLDRSVGPTPTFFWRPSAQPGQRSLCLGVHCVHTFDFVHVMHVSVVRGHKCEEHS